MSTANKLTYLNVTKQKLKQAINNIGGEVTDETTFRNYVAELENAYDRLPKTEFEEGESVTLENTLKGKLDFDDGKVGFGQASQKTTNGYQLLSLTNGSYSVSGITAKVQDGEITLNGTSTSGASIYIPIVDISLLTTDKFSFAFNRTSDFPSGMGAYFTDSSKALIRWDFGQAGLRDATNFSPQADITAHYFHIAVNTTGTSFSNFKLKPMFEKGATSHTWEQYSGGYASPSPNWKQQVKCVAGKNIFDGELEEGGIRNGEKIDVGTGVNLRSKNYIKVSSNTSYAFSVNSVLNKVVVNFYTSSKTWIDRDNSEQGTLCENGIFTTPSNCEYVLFRCYQADYSLFQNGNIQLEEGIEATPFKPYNTIEETISGKNLFDNVVINKSSNIQYEKTETGCKLSAIETSSVVSNLFALFIVGDTNKLNGVRINLDMSVTNLSNRYGYYIGYCDASGNNRTIIESSRTTTQTGHRKVTMVVDNTVYANMKVCVVLFGVDGYAPTAGDYTEFDNVMVYTGEQAEDVTYEPYKTPKTYQFSLGDHKFYGIGDYKDELVYDVDEDKLYKLAKIQKVTFNGTENWTKSSNTSLDRYILGQNLNGIVNQGGYCNYFKVATINVPTEIGYVSNNNNEQFIVNYSEYNQSTLESFKTWLTTHNLDYYFVKNTPTLTEIPDTTLKTQVKALYNAHSNNGTTIITSNGNLPMIIKVRGLKGE